MKTLLNILILFFLLSSCQNKPVDISKNEITPEEIQFAKDLIQGSFDDLWAGVDSTKISNYHTDDFIILENGEVWDNDRIIENMRSQLIKPDRPEPTEWNIFQLINMVLQFK